MAKKTYIFFTDPGHGWLRVPLTELEPIKNKISACSYMNDKYAYLEEDCDASKFLKYKFGKDTSFDQLNKMGVVKDKYSNKTTIRDLEYYHVRTEEEIALMKVVKSTLLNMNFKKSVKVKIRKASYEDCQYWQKHYGIKTI